VPAGVTAPAQPLPAHCAVQTPARRSAAKQRFKNHLRCACVTGGRPGTYCCALGPVGVLQRNREEGKSPLGMMLPDGKVSMRSRAALPGCNVKHTSRPAATDADSNPRRAPTVNVSGVRHCIMPEVSPVAHQSPTCG
jgi:hypothetical protein